MRRTIPLVRPACALALLALLAGAMGVRADTASEDPLAGTTIKALGSFTPAEAAGYNVVLLRLTLEPKTTITDHSHPGGVVLLVESGTFATTFTLGSATISRAPETGGGEATTEEAILDEEVILEPGDSVAYGSDTHHVMRNVGDEPLVLIASALLAVEQPGFIFTEPDAG